MNRTQKLMSLRSRTRFFMIPGVTAGGCRNYLESFWKNPQYTVTLNDPDEDDEENKCTVSSLSKQPVYIIQRHFSYLFSYY